MHTRQKMNKQLTEREVFETRIGLLWEFRYMFYAQWDCVCGGPLHILLDDGNVKDSDIQFCREELQLPRWDHIRELGTVILDMLGKLSPAQRLYWYEHREMQEIWDAANKDIEWSREKNDEDDLEPREYIVDNTLPIEYEEVSSITINDGSVYVCGTSVKVGDKLRCRCEYEVIKLYPVWHSDTGKHWPEHKGNSFSHRMIKSLNCPIHYGTHDE
jgi:hypothetical protein